MNGDLRISEAAKLISVHVNTLRNFERRGLIKPLRDHNGWRRYSVEETLKIKELVNLRSEQSKCKVG